MATAASDGAPPTLITSVQRALRLLEAASAHPAGAPAKVLARQARLPLPTAYHLLRTLAHEGYLRREKGVFVLGDALERLTPVGATAQNRRSKLEESLEHWRDAIGVPVYFAVYREGEIDIAGIADAPHAPAVREWADFRATGHAHALGQCLLGQLDEAALHDHLDRYPVRPLTPCSVPDRRTLLDRIAARRRMDSVIERQEYAAGTVCAAIPITAGSGAAAMAISLPLDQEERLLPAIEQLRTGIGSLLGSLAFSISI
ncbi:IclR family transcriptional regulator C-terminal domain-containing protein [Streptomyces sp. NPDC048057]|uniref:IclR family transcriptional regulator n=1 Tax=Streptomyces sp. NPDC048057 TaxID=3155628 RepID=UPI0034071E4F